MASKRTLKRRRQRDIRTRRRLGYNDANTRITAEWFVREMVNEMKVRLAIAQRFTREYR